MPALTKFVDGTGPLWTGRLFPFLFITIACGAVSGFHALISSGTTPKLLANETDARFIGYGGMLMESFVAIMALVAASYYRTGSLLRDEQPAMASSCRTCMKWAENAPMIAAQLEVTATRCDRQLGLRDFA